MADDKAAESGVRGGGGEEVAMNAAAEVAKDASGEGEAKGGSGQAPATEVPCETHPDSKAEAEDKSDKANAPEGGKPAGAVAGGGEAKPKSAPPSVSTPWAQIVSKGRAAQAAAAAAEAEKDSSSSGKKEEEKEAPASSGAGETGSHPKKGRHHHHHHHGHHEKGGKGGGGAKAAAKKAAAADEEAKGKAAAAPPSSDVENESKQHAKAEDDAEGEEGGEAKPAEIKSTKPAKPAWNKPVADSDAQTKAPLADIHGEPTWPSLGDAKSEPQKKGQTAVPDSKPRSAPSVPGKGVKGGKSNKPPPVTDVSQRNGGGGNAPLSPGATSPAGSPSKSQAIQSDRFQGSGNRGGGSHGQGGRGGGGPGRGAGGSGRGGRASDGQWGHHGQTGPQGGGRGGGRGGRGGRGGGHGAFRSGYQGGRGMPNVAATPMYYPPAGAYPQPMYYPTAAFGGVPAPVDPNAKEAVRLAVKKQIEYYFSVENLCKDIFLRSKMDEDGFIPLAVIASFNRVRMLTPDPLIIVEALEDSETVETSKDREFLRARSNYVQWVLPEAQRDTTGHRPKAVLVPAVVVAPLAAARPVPSVPPRKKKVAAADEDDLELNEEDMFQLDEDRKSVV